MVPARAPGVRESTAVRLDQALDQLLGPPFGQLLLPICEEDPAAVLLVGPMLREQTRPALRVCVDLITVAGSQLSMHAVPWDCRLHRGLAFVNDAGIPDVEADPHPIDIARMSGDRTVPKV
jgi:hypothetical protein